MKKVHSLDFHPEIGEAFDRIINADTSTIVIKSKDNVDKVLSNNDFIPKKVEDFFTFPIEEKT